MVPITELGASLGRSVVEWRGIGISELLFSHRNAARLAVAALSGLSLAVAFMRLALAAKRRRSGVGLPAILPVVRPSALAFVRHGALFTFLLGLPFFVLALADPYTAITRQEVSYPGRRIGLLIDASSSMAEPFKADRLGAGAPSNAAFFTAVAAAQSFVKQRINGKYKDLMALIEFGDEAYVITPFTTDYDNILLSISLIDDLAEFNRFPDQGTTIGVAINQGVKLFSAFDFLNAAGNLLVVFSDGQDTKVTAENLHGASLDDIMSAAARARVPVYFIRTVYNQQIGAAFTDRFWRPAVEKTGGKFYAAADETSILNAIDEIDKVAGGRIEVGLYSTERPWFTVFALLAVAFWTAALVFKLTVPYFRKFP
jgi:Ca-activated chloride channel family protein